MKNYHIVQKNLSAKIIKRSSELLKIPKTFSRKKISKDQWRIFKIKKKNPTKRSFRVEEDKFSPRWSRSWWTEPPVVSGFIFPSEPRSRTSCVWTMHRAKKFAWMARKSGEFPSFSPWSVFHSPLPSSSQPRNEEKQTRSTRCLSVEERKLRGARRGWPPSGRANFLRFSKAPPLFFFFSFQRNVIGCSLAWGNFMKLPTQAPDFWPGSSFTKIWNSIIREEIWSLVISLIKFSRETSREINYLERVGSWSFLFANISEKNKRIITW